MKGLKTSVLDVSWFHRYSGYSQWPQKDSSANIWVVLAFTVVFIKFMLWGKPLALSTIAKIGFLKGGKKTQTNIKHM